MADTLDPTTRAALDQLLVVAGTDSGQGRKVANFLLAWYNAGENGGFDLTDLWGLDAALVAACTVVFVWVAGNRAYPDTLGYGEQFEALAKAWRPQA